jgi:DNA repair protein RecN (Recombination protein N)
LLEHISIKDFAIIEDLSLPLYPGLTVLTGETGAGKSVIVDALQTVLGDKVDPAMVRTGVENSLIEAAFSTSGISMADSIDAPEGELVIGREVRKEGRGRVTINGSMNTVSVVRNLGEGLVDFHGQHEHQSLLRTAVHLEALDAFAVLLPQRRRFAELYRELIDMRSRIDAIQLGKKERLARQDYLRFVVGELESAALSEDEEEQLIGEERILSAAEKLLHATSSALEETYQGEGSSADKARSAAVTLRTMVETDGRLLEIVELLEASVAQMEEAGYLLRDYAAAVEADPARLQEVGERLGLISILKKKYGPAVKEVLQVLEDARLELDLIEEGESGLEDLRAREAELVAETGRLAEELGRQRRQAAIGLQEKVQLELSELAMEKVRFAASFTDVQMSETGTDEVEFLISPNPGEPLLPLRKIASGGELSRVMLALKRILAGADRIPTLVFDEVDAGIGGRVAAVLGHKLKDIARHHQVLCITHLAPVAAFSDRHILVEKSEKKGRTIVGVRYLDEEERVAELARMMGGIEVTSSIVRSARELLEEARGRTENETAQGAHR